MKWLLERRLHFAFSWGLLLVAAPSFAADSGTTDGCTAFTWDVSHELAAMTKPPKQIEASRDSGGESVRIEIDQHYVVHLAPQTESISPPHL